MHGDAQPNVLTLVAAADAKLDEATLSAVAHRLPQASGRDWLSPNVACDLAFETSELEARREELEAGILATLDGRPIDIAIQALKGRRKKLLIADMDATIVVGETLDELAAHTGLKDEIAGITARAMRGELDFAAALRERVAMLAGLAESALAETYKGIESMPGAGELVATMKAHGAYAALVSGGFDYFTGRIRERFGFDLDSANTLEITGGHLTGRVIEPIRGRDAKREMLMNLCRRLGIGPDSAMAIGDGANDLAMVAEAGLGVAYQAKPALRDAARFRVDHGDLRAPLYFQGYRQSEIHT